MKSNKPNKTNLNQTKSIEREKKKTNRDNNQRENLIER